MPFKYNLTIAEEKEIVEMYMNHMSIDNISKKYPMSPSTIGKILKRNGVEMRKHYRCTFDEHYFDLINTSNKAYLLGFIYADGCINKNHSLSFTQHEKDIEILECFVRELQATNKITQVKGKPHVRLNFCSKHMCDTLRAMGCGGNKTFALTFPDIDMQFIYDFIRGFMDGDGCISICSRKNKKYINLSFTGTLDMMTTLKNIFEVDNKITEYRHAYSLNIGKTQDVKRILTKIYDNANLYLSRKYNKYMEYLEYEKEKDNAT